MLGLHVLRRHPLPVEAFFTYSLVLTFAFPPELLRPLLAPGLVLDTWRDHAFVAVAMVDAVGLRPAGAPRWLGQDFFLAGYRVFARVGGRRSLRGLRMLRSDTNRLRMVAAGNLLTHYGYRLARVRTRTFWGRVEIEVVTRGGEADLHVVANAGGRAAALPAGSPFRTMAEARRFAGPLPWTFDHEPETGSLVAVRAARERWDPEPVDVRVLESRFFDQPPFAGTRPVLANAFQVSGVPYRWERGRRL